MSFNYLEIARATEIIQTQLPDEVIGVDLVRFPLQRGAVPDVNVAIKFKHAKKMIVFSLKQPWVGLFWLPSQLFPSVAPKGQKANWSASFNGCEGPLPEWSAYIHGQQLERIAAEPGDRVVTLSFGNGALLRVELFPARPNWVLTAAGIEARWRSSLPQRPVAAPSVPAQLTLRDFGAGEDSDLWMARAYEHYLKAREKTLLQTQISRGLSQLQGRLSRLFKIRAQMEGQLSESNKAGELKTQSEALKARLYEFPQGYKSRELDGVALDARYSVAENVTRMFARLKKLQRTKKEIEARMVGVEEESKRLTAAVARVRAFKGEYLDFLKLATELGLTLEEERPEWKKEKKTDRRWSELEKKSGVRKFQSREGLAIWVGRNHKENEELVIRLAKGNDLWMHLKGRPGAHVVVQMPAKKSPSLETLLDGATLVAYYSGVSDKEKVEVDYTFRKYVKRVPGGGEKFLVTYTQNKTLMVKMEDERLWRLLKQH